MENPWLTIQCTNYENHMIEVGQAQVLSELTKYCLDKYQPETFALLGCATGNGLEHVRPGVTKRVYAIDINQEYLNKTKEKFKNKIRNLEIVKVDIQRDELMVEHIDLFFVGLVLEYVEPDEALKKITQTLNEKGTLFLVIQKNKSTSFVSRTKYKSLERLADISNEVEESNIDKFISSENMELIKKEEIELTENKSFIMLEYRKQK